MAPRPRRGPNGAPAPPKTADLTRLTRDRRDDGRSGRRNRRLDRTKEQPGVLSPCSRHHPSLTVAHPVVGETEQASDTEIRTLPQSSVNWPPQQRFRKHHNHSAAPISFEPIWL